ncbi:MAG: trans-2-enoyl-CoA reductase family protein [Spirochaeta sp.]|jgi:enoyl-[acyl-carrier protein] reductase/trans-2-enoyl-CoA reductase (NAD+)|nr:trans-2-enoyl-CoA reductase family protein [Spirochaeta sp.]
MVIKPMIRNNICMNAHPVGCAVNVQRQIDYVRSRGTFDGPKNVVVIGASGGYGLASRIAAAFGAGAATIGVSYESPAKGSRTGTAGWYQDLAFREAAEEAGLVHRSFIGDAFSHETKDQVISAVKELMGTADLVVYSLASGVRVDPDTGEMYRSALKPIGRRYESITLDGKTGTLKSAAIDPATDDEIEQTVKVMGGEDWNLWIDAFEDAGVLADNAVTLAYSYIGPDLTFPLYRDGTIGRAKEHLEETARTLDRRLQERGGRAWVSVNKALVTRASSVIPAVPLYLAILYRVMKEHDVHEGTIEQMDRMLRERIYSQFTDGAAVPVDEAERIRMDDWEMREDIQKIVHEAWNNVNEENLAEHADLEGFQRDFLQIHGFGFDEVDYEADVEI